MSPVGETLRALRLRSNLSQAELAALMGVHKNTVFNMERRPEAASLDLLTKAASALGVKRWKILRFADSSQVGVTESK